MHTQLGLAPAPLPEQAAPEPPTTTAAEQPTLDAPDRKSRELLELAKTQPGAPPFVDTRARTHRAADTPGTPPTAASAPAAVVAAPASDRGAQSPTRTALSSEAFATTQDRVSDLVIPGLEPSWLSRLRPGMSVGRLLGLGTLALLSACAPIALLGLGISLLFGDAGTARSVAIQEREEPRVEAAVPARAGPAITKQVTKSTAANLPEQANTDPNASATSTGIPWTVRAPSALPPCQNLVDNDARGPAGFLLQKAIKTGQQELIRGNVKAAHVAFCEASLLVSGNATVLHGLAQVLLMQSDLEGALTTADQLLTLEPGDRRARELRGDILVRMGRTSEAREAWFRAAGASRASATLVANLIKASRNSADAAFKAGDLMRTDRMLRRVIALEPKDVDASAGLAAVLHKQGHTQAARSWLGYAETLEPGHARVQAVKHALDG